MFKNIKVHVPTVMHTEEVEVQLYSFITPALDSSECCNYMSQQLFSYRKKPSTE